jgi:hypothetical protein
MGGSRTAHLTIKQSLLSFEISCIEDILRYFKCSCINTGLIPYRKIPESSVEIPITGVERTGWVNPQRVTVNWATRRNYHLMCMFGTAKFQSDD